jgi:uncharacterized DUF497 family protein
MKFSWDPNKEKINRRDHKVSFFDACQVFADQCLLTVYDQGHSADEERWISMGQISNGKIMVVVILTNACRKRNL